MVTSPTHRYRHEVAFTFRVFSPHEVSKILGSSIPVQPWRLRALGSSGFPVALRTRGRDSSDDPLLAFSSPSRHRPNNLARHPSTTSTSLGVPCPFNALGEGSPRPHRVSPMLAPWVLPRRLRAVPNHSVRCRSQAFSASQRLIPPPTVPPYFRQVALVGFTLQGFNPLQLSPATCRRRVTLLTFSRGLRFPRS